jgi:hypothetical protein
MPETWVHGDSFFARLTGPNHLVPVDGIPGTEVVGKREGFGVKFIMRNERINAFCATIPVESGAQLTEVNAEYLASRTSLIEAAIYVGRKVLIVTRSPMVSSVDDPDLGTSRFFMSGMDAPINRGLCVRLVFSSFGTGLSGGQINFFGAGAIFA